MTGAFQGWNSIRIPRISRNYSEQIISQMFYDLGIGCVERVDFVAIPNQETSPFRTAYVHVKSWYNTQIMHKIRQAIDSAGSYRMMFHDGTYCFFQRMTCDQVPTTDQNIHQLAVALTAMEARLRATEEQLASKSSEHAVAIDQIGEQASRIADLEYRLGEYDAYYENEANEWNDETFGEDDQEEINHNIEIEEGEVDEAGFNSTYYHEMPDITRMSLDELAALVQDPNQAFDCGSLMDVDQDDDVSTHSSMPELMEIDSDDDDQSITHSSMPDLMEIDSDEDSVSVNSSDSERLRTTRYLCDNY